MADDCIMHVKTLKDPKHNTHGTIDCTLVLEDGTELPFTASPNDPEQYGREMHSALARGEFGPIEEYSE